MYARDLMLWLHERLAERGTFEETRRRFESLRGYGLLPRGRENAGRRLFDEQIASGVLGFAHPLPGFTGHASLVLGGLRPVGGTEASFHNEPDLQSAVAALIGAENKSSDLLRLTLSVEHDFSSDEYAAAIRFRDDGQTKTVTFVSKYASSLMEPGSEQLYDHDRLDKLTAVERSFGAEFFRNLAGTVSISRHLNRPFKADWRDYEQEEEKDEFHRRLGAKRSSDFLNLRVEAQVTWPNEPTRIEFGGYHLVLFPKTRDHSRSVSIDLRNECISADNARSLINRLLSVMSWCTDQPASLHEGWSGSPVPTPVKKLDLASMTAREWYFCRRPTDDEQLGRCLAFYRDGLNAISAGLASHAVLSFFRVIETKFGHKKWEIIRWINAAYEKMDNPITGLLTAYERDRESTGLSHGEYVYKRCRVATAHAASDAPSDPDGTEETRRLLNAARAIQNLARHFIKQEFNLSDSYLSD